MERLAKDLHGLVKSQRRESPSRWTILLKVDIHWLSDEACCLALTWQVYSVLGRCSRRRIFPDYPNLLNYAREVRPPL